jgi:tetratricopeptide (TPR) repeat protein
VKPALEFFQTLPEGAPLEDGFATAFSKSIKDFEGASSDTEHGSGFRGYVREARVGKSNSAGGWYVNLAGFSLDPNRKEIRTFFYKAAKCKETVESIGTIPVEVDVPCGATLMTIPVNRDVTWADIKDQNVRLLSEAETDFYRGDLMLHIDRLDEAEGLLQLARRIDPKLPAVHAALGSLQTRLGHQEEALQSLRQALTLSDDNYLAHYYYALALRNASQKGTPPSAARDLVTIATELKKAVELAPRFVEAKVMLAEVNAQRQQDLDEMLDLVREAAKQSPGREDLTLTLARVLAANRNNQEAGRLLDRVAASRTAESFMKDAAEVLRSSLSEAPEAPAATQEFFARNDEPAQQSVETRAGVDDIPEGVLVPVNPRKLPEGETVSGKLSMLDCSSGLTVVVDVGGKTVRLHSNTPDKIEFVTLSDAVGRSISCGPLPSLPATIIFRPDSSGKTAGEPIRIEFTEDRSGK